MTTREEIATAVQEGTLIPCHDKPIASPGIVPCWMLLGHTGEVITMDPDFDLEYDLILLVSQNDPAWTDTIDDLLMGPNNVFVALQRSRGTATRWDDYGQFNWGGVDYWSVRVPVAIAA